MENNTYKKIYFTTLCIFWHRGWSWYSTQHIQKLATQDLWILRYNRSRVFTFLFFMLKISGNRLGEYNKSCRIFHNESNKIKFDFFWIFYDFSKFQLNPNTIWDQTCTQVPGNKLKSQNYPYFAAWPLGRMWALQLGPRGTGRRRSGQIPTNRRPCPARRRQRTACGSPWPDSQAWLEQRATGAPAQRSRAAVAAGATAPPRRRSIRGNRWWWELLWTLEQVQERQHCQGSEWEREVDADSDNGGDDAWACTGAHEETHRVLYTRASRQEEGPGLAVKASSAN
jgi:hypothetical protein